MAHPVSEQSMVPDITLRLFLTLHLGLMSKSHAKTGSRSRFENDSNSVGVKLLK